MRAALLTGYGLPLAVGDVAEPAPGPGEALVRVEACGVCRSDWHLWQGDWRSRLPLTFPHIMGHEIAGEVVGVGADTTIAPPRRVVVPFHLSCADCAACRAGATNRCTTYSASGFSRPGGFAEYLVVPHADANLIPLPDGVSPEAGAALGCRFMTAYHGLIERGRLNAGECVAVFGVGGVGLSAVQIAARWGARVIAVDLHRAALDAALREGAEHAVRADAGTTAATIRELSGGGADVTVDALGSAATTVPALRALAKGGRHVQLGLTSAREGGEFPIPVDLMVRNELELLGSFGCPATGYPALLAAVAEGRLDPASLIRRRLGLEDVSRALAGMTQFAETGIAVVLPAGGSRP